jgi:hypothetical protein
VHEAETVIVENKQRSVANPQAERMTHHVGDAIGPAVIFRVRVAAIPLKIDDGSVIAVA